MSLLSRIERLGDAIERRMPWFLRDDKAGDPASWLQHTLVCLALTTGFALATYLAPWIGDALPGAKIGASLGLIFYAHRELEDARHHMKARDPAFRWRRSGARIKVGWGADLLGDIAGPLALWLYFVVIA